MAELTWGDLASQFHPMVLVTPRTAVDPASAERWPPIHPRVVIYLRRNGAGHPWSDHLALAATVMLTRRLDLATVLGYLRTVQTFFPRTKCWTSSNRTTRWVRHGLTSGCGICRTWTTCAKLQRVSSQPRMSSPSAAVTRLKRRGGSLLRNGAGGTRSDGEHSRLWMLVPRALAAGRQARNTPLRTVKSPLFQRS